MLIHKLKRHIERFLNQRHCYDYPPTSNGWQKYGSMPVWGSQTQGTMFDPYCFFKNQLFQMVVSDRKRGTLILLLSTDGIHWTYNKTLLTGINNSWDTIVNRGCLIEHNNELWLWYTGQHNNISCIGLAKSKNGKAFIRISKKPIIQGELEHEGLSVMNPCVIWDSEVNKFKMWYSAGENYEPDVICYAESPDGINWTKHQKPVLTKKQNHKWEQYKIGGCQVIKNEKNIYTMYYIGYQNIDVARICIASSKDGICWERENNNLLISPTQGGWDSDATYKPTVVKINNKYFLWYNGRKKNNEYIGLAIKIIK